MNVDIAIRTLTQINDMIEEDQGASFRVWQGRVMPHMEDAYRGEDGGHRGHLGASLLGGECGRAIYYGFRWVTRGKFPGRVLRLFNRGHLEEARFIAMLLMIGCEVYQQDENGKQFRISFAHKHGGGSGDGIARGVPDLQPGTDALCEFKTHGEKSFIDLAGKLDEWRKFVEGRGNFTGKGLRFSKFEHYVQMQLYMRKMGLAAGLYMAVNKNTDDLYAEIVPLNPELADQFVARGEELVTAKTPPSKINESPGFWKCRFCDHNPVCHKGKAPDMNCRTCQFSEPVVNGEWWCSLHKNNLPIETQRVGCMEYQMASHYK